MTDLVLQLFSILSIIFNIKPTVNFFAVILVNFESLKSKQNID